MNVNLLAASEGPFCTPEPQDEGFGLRIQLAVFISTCNSMGRKMDDAMAFFSRTGGEVRQPSRFLLRFRSHLHILTLLINLQETCRMYFLPSPP